MTIGKEKKMTFFPITLYTFVSLVSSINIIFQELYYTYTHTNIHQKKSPSAPFTRTNSPTI